ncbi:MULTISPECIES: sensor histidine kinase [Terrisporobacter]|uniref:histidine kinase n=1 Tax=Terrisporobacter muris TaxID=2963284 RepID=A0A9X2S1Y3_9FIRM|nr:MULTISPECIES: sensor histidine kinase [Terrisporobacter]MCR1823498.1 sensor histidine kinase [Terrisporobacter muris]MDY3373163.1 sensor histidine kinase [Terrisporobacter othiniensis]
MGNIFKMRKSITLKLFLLLFILIVLISLSISVEQVKNTNKIVNKEMEVMREQVLDEVANNISILLSNVETMGDTIVVDSHLMEILATSHKTIFSNKELEKNMNSYVEGLLNDVVWEYGRYNMKPELYIVGNNGYTYSTYSKNKYYLNNIKEELWYEEIVKSDGDTVLINTYKDENGIGPYKNIFKMGRLIKDIITNETLGILIMDISETMLYDRYSKMIDNGSFIYITDSSGKIISSKDKRDIGKNYKDIFNNDDRNIDGSVNSTKIISQIEEYEWNIIQEIPSNISMKISNKIISITTLIIMFVSFIALIITYKLSKWITKPIIQIKNKMQEVTGGNLKSQIIVNREDEIGDLQESFNSMVNQLNTSIENIKESEKQKRVAELSFLQAQINPHFLYNTLSGIRFLISMGKNEEAEEMLYRFTKLLRAILPKASEMITLGDEIENIKNYGELQQMRYPNSFEIEYHIEERVLDFKIPSFILQPILENAILYSMEKENNFGYIKVTASEENEHIKIIIEDNGIGMSKDKLITVLNKGVSINSVGVTNVHERIQLNYGMKYGLRIESEEGKGTKVIFILPNLREGIC